MKRILITVLPVAVLTGCPGYRDEVPGVETGEILLRQGQVCMTVLPKGDEKLAAISVYRQDKPDETRLFFFNPPESIRAGQCVPTNGYTFTADVTYRFSAKLISPQREQTGKWPFSREFSVEFKLKENQGQQVMQIINETPL